MSINVNANATDQGKRLVHFWNVCVGAGRANEGLRAGWLEQLAQAARDCGFRYVRFHGLFHDDMFVYREDKGRPVYNWQYVDDLFDRMLAVGVRPFVELGFCPRDMATEHGTCFWWKGHGSPPKDYAAWGALVENFVRHCLERYGEEEVRQWYFEVWNEPNLDPFFKGTRTQYFELYRVTARTIKKVCANLRVGGPTTSNFVATNAFDGEKEDPEANKFMLKAADLSALTWRPVWVQAFLDFCKRENLPVDFVSTHPYPTDFALDEKGEGRGRTRSVNSTAQDLSALRELVDASAFPNAEIHLTEWNSSPSARDFAHDYPQAATYIVKANLDSTGFVDSLSYWTFTDVFEEGGAGDAIFHGGFGMITYRGVVKPSFHAYRFLAALGDEELARADGAIITRSSKTRGVSALLYNYPAEVPTAPPMANDRVAAEAALGQGKPRDCEIVIAGLASGARFEIETVDAEHGFALREWEKMGAPHSPSREQLKTLEKAANATGKDLCAADGHGTLYLKRRLAPWGMALIRQISGK